MRFSIVETLLHVDSFCYMSYGESEITANQRSDFIV
jgi:hypothetical protein